MINKINLKIYTVFMATGKKGVYSLPLADGLNIWVFAQNLHIDCPRVSGFSCRCLVSGELSRGSPQRSARETFTSVTQDRLIALRVLAETCKSPVSSALQSCTIAAAAVNEARIEAPLVSKPSRGQKVLSRRRRQPLPGGLRQPGSSHFVGAF